MTRALTRDFLRAQPLPEGARAADWKDWTDALHRFLAEQFPQQDIEDLIRARADLVDQMLQTLWRERRLDAVEDLSLLAVGGYGRGELHPYSDIDILVLYRGRRAPEALGAFFQDVWDGGLKLSQSVRTVSQCRQDARRDLALMTSWLEMRPLCGDAGLMRELEQNLTPRTGLLRPSLWTKEQFFFAKIEERETRHAQFGGDAWRLEPNLKEGPGGLRDIQTIHWILKRHEDLAQSRDFCTPRELKQMREGQRFLWKVRFALHTLSEQAEERLLFNYQYRAARLLGYPDDTINGAVEAFMQDYYRTVGEIHHLTEVLSQQYRESLQPPRRGGAEILNADFQVSDGYLETRDGRVFERHPQALLELFLLMQRHPDIQGVRAHTIREVRANLHRINAAFRATPAARARFLDILREPRHVARELRRMSRYGVLSRYWPDFAGVVGMMQFDLFHIHPVDEHTLQVLRELRAFSRPPPDGENPLYHELFLQFPKPELLYLAALFHDIGKGRDGDHSAIGSALAQEFCAAHDLSAYDTGMVRWLVEHHLEMSMTSQKRDISDAGVVQKFAAAVGNGVRLRGLFLLTIADLRGTNPALWTPWREALLYQLYAAADRQLQRGLGPPIDAARQIRDLKASARAKIPPDAREAAAAFWEALPDSDLLHYTDDELAWQAASIAARRRDLPTQVFARHQGELHCTEVLIYDESRARLFVPITGALARLGANVLYARITKTKHQHVLQTFLVTDAEGQPIRGAYALEELRATLQDVAQRPETFDRPVRLRPRRQVRHFDIPTQISFVQIEAPPQTRIHLSTSDHPGLLWAVSRALDSCQVQITQARITTLGAQVQDVFTVTDAESRPIRDPQLQAQISRAVEEHIERLADYASEVA